MTLRDAYIITTNTIAILPEYDNFGNLYARILEGSYSFLVKMSPLEVIENSIYHYGHSLAGARTAARLAIGNIDMVPIKISCCLDIYWFPTQSPSCDKNIWFSLKHIIRTEELTRNQAIVYLEYGHTITVATSASRFKNKESNGLRLRKVYDDRKKKNKHISYGYPKGLPGINEDNTNTYHFIQLPRKKKKKDGKREKEGS